MLFLTLLSAGRKQFTQLTFLVIQWLFGALCSMAYPAPVPMEDRTFQRQSKLAFYIGSEPGTDPVCYGASDSLNGFFIVRSCLQKLINTLDNNTGQVMMSVESETTNRPDQVLTLKRRQLQFYTGLTEELVFVHGLPEPDSSIWQQIQNSSPSRNAINLKGKTQLRVYKSHSTQKRSEPLLLSDCSLHSCTLSEYLPDGHPVYDRHGNLLCLARENTLNCFLARKPRQTENGMQEECMVNQTTTPTHERHPYIPDDLNSEGFINTMIALCIISTAVFAAIVKGACCACCICCGCACMLSKGDQYTRR